MRNTSRLYVALPIEVQAQQIQAVSSLQDDGGIFLDLGEIGNEPFLASRALIAHHQPGIGDYLVHESGELTSHSRDHILPKSVFERNYRPLADMSVPVTPYPWPGDMPYELGDTSSAAVAWREDYQSKQHKSGRALQYPWPDKSPYQLNDMSPAAVAWRDNYQRDMQW